MQIRASRVKVFAMTRRKTIKSAKLKGNINHSVCRWCFDKIKLDDLCVPARKWASSRLTCSTQRISHRQKIWPHLLDGEFPDD